MTEEKNFNALRNSLARNWNEKSIVFLFRVWFFPNCALVLKNSLITKKYDSMENEPNDVVEFTLKSYQRNTLALFRV